MSKEAATHPERSARGGRAYWPLAALGAGLALGAMGAGFDEAALKTANIVGGLWLNALKMTVVPLIVVLLVTGIARGVEAAQGGRIAGRTVAWIVAVCTASALFGALMMELLTAIFPLSATSAEALRSGIAGLDPAAASAPVPGVADFITGIIPSNVIASASNGDVLPLVIFSLLFALAVARLAAGPRRTVVSLFEAIADALLVIIGWVLLVAPIGVFALGFTVGAAAGSEAFAALGHYVVLISAIGLLVTLAGYPLAIFAGRTGPGLFTRAMIAPQAVAISTRSSLASLPAMLASARAMGIREQVADISLPISVALFRATGPAMNTAVAFYVAHWLGLEPTLGQMIAATAVGAVMSYASVSLPGEITFISSIAPIALALGVPIAPLGLFVAVEMIPDIFRTVGNVTLDVAVTTAVDRSTRTEPVS